MSFALGPKPRHGLRSLVGVGLMGLSFVPWLSVLAIPFLGLSVAGSGVLALGLFAVGEGLFWAGAALAGRSLLEGLWRRLPWRRKRRDPGT